MGVEELTLQPCRTAALGGCRGPSRGCAPVLLRALGCPPASHIRHRAPLGTLAAIGRVIKWEACLIGRMGSATSRTSWLNCGCVACCVAGHEVALAGFQMRNAVHGHYSLGVLARSSRPADTGPPLVLASFYLRGPAAHTGPLPDADPGEEAGLLSSSGDAAQAPALSPVQRLASWRAAAAERVWSSGVVCILASAAFFAVAASLVKAIDKEVSLFQVIVIRSGLSMVASLVAGRASGISPLYGQLCHWPLLGRCAVCAACAACAAALCCWGHCAAIRTHMGSGGSGGGGGSSSTMLPPEAAAADLEPLAASLHCGAAMRGLTGAAAMTVFYESILR